MQSFSGKGCNVIFSDFLLNQGVSEESVAYLATCPWASAVGTDQFGKWADFTASGATQKFRYIPGGVLPKVAKSSYHSIERPAQIIEPFWLGNTPVTQEFWDAQNPDRVWDYRFKGPKNPVESVSPVTFLSKLEYPLGIAENLEWEFAYSLGARKGRPEGYSREFLDEESWNYDNSNGTTHPVGELLPTDLGLYDMFGNVMELVTREHSSEEEEDHWSSSSVFIPFCFKGGSFQGSTWKASEIQVLDINRQDKFYFRHGFRLAIRTQPGPNLSIEG